MADIDLNTIPTNPSEFGNLGRAEMYALEPMSGQAFPLSINPLTGALIVESSAGTILGVIDPLKISTTFLLMLKLRAPLAVAADTSTLGSGETGDLIIKTGFGLKVTPAGELEIDVDAIKTTAQQAFDNQALGVPIYTNGNSVFKAAEATAMATDEFATKGDLLDVAQSTYLGQIRFGADTTATMSTIDLQTAVSAGDQCFVSADQTLYQWDGADWIPAAAQPVQVTGAYYDIIFWFGIWNTATWNGEPTATIKYSGTSWDLLVHMPVIVDGSITTAKLAPGAVTEQKIADNAVTDPKIGLRTIEIPTPDEHMPAETSAETYTITDYFQKLADNLAWLKVNGGGGSGGGASFDLADPMMLNGAGKLTVKLAPGNSLNASGQLQANLGKPDTVAGRTNARLDPNNNWQVTGFETNNLTGQFGTDTQLKTGSETGAFVSELRQGSIFSRFGIGNGAGDIKSIYEIISSVDANSNRILSVVRTSDGKARLILSRDESRASALALERKAELARIGDITAQEAFDQMLAGNNVYTNGNSVYKWTQLGVQPIDEFATKGDLMGAVNILYLGQIKYGADTAATRQTVVINDPTIQNGDLCWDQSAQLVYQYSAGSWTALPALPTSAGNYFDLVFWYGSWHGVNYQGEVSASIKYSTANNWDLLVYAQLLPNGSVTTVKLADGAVTTVKIADQAVTQQKIGGQAVGTAQLQDNSVTGAKFADNSITTPKLADGSVTNPKLANDAVTEQKILNDSVTTNKLRDQAVTPAKVQNKSLGAGQIADNAITDALIGNRTIGASTADSNLFGDTAAAYDLTPAFNKIANNLKYMKANLGNPFTPRETLTLQRFSAWTSYSNPIQNYYVNPGSLGVDDVSDYERGLSATKPWKTITYALAQIASRPNNGRGYTTLYLATGTYAERVNISYMDIILSGDTANPGNVIIRPPDSSANYTIALTEGFALIRGVDIRQPVTVPTAYYSLVYVQSNGFCQTQDCRYYSTSSYVRDILCTSQSYAYDVRGTHYGGARDIIWYAAYQANLMVSAANLSVSMTIGTAIAFASYQSNISFINATTATGTRTGKQYEIKYLSTLAALSYMPSATVAGTTATGANVV